MQKRGFLITLVLLLFATVILSYFNQETTGNVVRRGTILATPIPTPQAPVAPPCLAPNIIPTTITTSITLCGNITMTAPTVITTSNVIVACDPGAFLIKASGTPIFDALQIAPGLTNVQITGCTFNGKFSNAMHISAGVTNSQIINNNIDSALVGIKETFNAQSNLYLGNTLKRTVTAMQLEGSQGTVTGSTITQNKYGIQTGTNPAGLTAATPNALCSLGTTIYEFPAQPLPVSCTIPQSGKEYTLTNNKLINNNKGIITYSTDNIINLNTLQSNEEGIQVNAIYVGVEINPFIIPDPQYPLLNIQEYFNAGHQITSNIITQNRLAGIQLNGRSTYFYQSSLQYHRKSIIERNTISNNGKQNTQQGDGIVVGRKDLITNPSIFDAQFQIWDEYTDINNNIIQNNFNDGVVLLNGFMTDVRNNTITNNLRNGISLGSTRQSIQIQGYYPDSSSPRFIYRNSINNNIQDGIHNYLGDLQNVNLNEINNNHRGIYVPAAPSGVYTQIVFGVICNDLSYNTLEGFNYDGKMTTGGQGYSPVYTFSHNRVLNNGADGIRYYISPNAYSPLTYNFFWLARTYNNHIEGNGFTPNPIYPNSGYGINVDGFYYYGFFANNFRNNNLGPAHDSGSLKIENMWDERQYELGYDNQICKNCGGNCTGDWDCGYYSGTCVNTICQPPPGSGLTCNPSTGNANCYANPTSLPYVVAYYYNYPRTYIPRGNFGLASRPFVVPPISPPLVPNSCTNHQQCTTNSCENYLLPINNQKCGNGNFINEPRPFKGYYQPPFDCPAGDYYNPAYFDTFPLNPRGSTTGDPNSLEEQKFYSSIPKEYKERQSLQEVFKDRLYLEKLRKDFEANFSSDEP